jgi:hypothetical protein
VRFHTAGAGGPKGNLPERRPDDITLHRRDCMDTLSKCGAELFASTPHLLWTRPESPIALVRAGCLIFERPGQITGDRIVN